MEALVTPSASTWRGRQVLITGHTGFKGAWLWLLLERLGARLAGISLAPDSEPNLASLTGIVAHPNSFEIDIRDRAALAAAISATSPEVVIHMAAQSLVRPSYKFPVDTWTTNVMGTINVLEAVRYVPSIQAVVVVTTDKCYKNHEWVWAYREIDQLGGHDPYSSSKAAVEIAVESWRASFFDGKAALATARAGNVIGGGDWALDRLIPDCARALIAGRTVEIRNPNSVRPWQHVLEPLTGYLLLAEALLKRSSSAQEAWNFGPTEADTDSVGRVVEIFARQWGSSASWISSPGPHPHEAGTLRIDAAKARERLSWRPRLNLETAVAWSADWYRRWNEGESPQTLCTEQIDIYLGMHQ
jgi:CDP-glucose 4,6-dehydratase